MKTHSAELLATVNSRRSPVIITQNGEPRAVVMDVESFEKMQDALVLLKLISQSEAEIRKGQGISHEGVVRRVKNRLGD